MKNSNKLMESSQQLAQRLTPSASAITLKLKPNKLKVFETVKLTHKSSITKIKLPARKLGSQLLTQIESPSQNLTKVLRCTKQLLSCRKTGVKQNEQSQIKEQPHRLTHQRHQTQSSTDLAKPPFLQSRPKNKAKPIEQFSRNNNSVAVNYLQMMKRDLPHIKNSSSLQTTNQHTSQIKDFPKNRSIIRSNSTQRRFQSLQNSTDRRDEMGQIQNSDIQFKTATKTKLKVIPTNSQVNVNETKKNILTSQLKLDLGQLNKAASQKQFFLTPLKQTEQQITAKQNFKFKLDLDFQSTECSGVPSSLQPSAKIFDRVRQTPISKLKIGRFKSSQMVHNQSSDLIAQETPKQQPVDQIQNQISSGKFLPTSGSPGNNQHNYFFNKLDTEIQHEFTAEPIVGQTDTPNPQTQHQQKDQSNKLNQQIRVKKIKKIKKDDFQDEFMSHYEEFSQSWRDQIDRNRRF